MTVATKSLTGLVEPMIGEDVERREGELATHCLLEERSVKDDYLTGVAFSLYVRER